MDLDNLTGQMEHNAHAIRALVQGVSDQQARWRPEPQAWSMLDVMNHLAYEEVHDFRDRLDLVLHRPQEDWPSGDAARGVAERRRQRGLERALQTYLSARDESLVWLRTLEAPDWDATHHAPFGEIRAGDVMAAWVAHDFLHLRQLIELRWETLGGDVEPYSVRYAGLW